MAEDVKLVLRYRVEANAPLTYQKPILLMEGDKRANVLQISLFDGEKAVDLTGLSVGGSVLRADGADVAIEGEIDGNVISCVLSEYAYAVAGPFKAFVQLLDSLGDVKRTVLLLAGMVESRGHGPQIDTGKELPSLDDILAQLETMRNVTQAANTAAGDANTAAAAANSAASKATGAANSATTAAGTANAAADRANDAAQNWEEGTAANSSLLANKPPEYYTWSNNLLYNSNFESPYLVNHLGYASGSAVSPWGEFINCWVNANDAEKAFTLSSDGITIPADTTIWQIANRVVDGETVTIAACDSNGDVYAASGTVRFNSDKSWYRCVTCNGNGFDVYVDTYQGNFEFIIYTVDSVKIKWAVLYKGAYTADTLPQPQWLHPRLEMIRMGLETQPVNLLDNSDFTNPVNQRGQTSYTTNWKYTIDRWIKAYCDSINLTDNGIVINNTNGTGNGGLRQLLPLKPGAYTIATKVQGAVYARTFTLSSDLSVTHGANTASAVNYQTYAGKDNSGFIQINLQTFTGATVTIEWVALYEGAYTTETLPPYVPKGYGAEFTECQKYYVRIKCKNKPLGSGHAFTADAVRILVPTPASMMTHKTPTITFETSDGVESNKAGTMLIATNGTLLTPTAVNSDGVARENGVILLCTVSGATTYQPASLYCSGIISFSADL